MNATSKRDRICSHNCPCNDYGIVSTLYFAAKPAAVSGRLNILLSHCTLSSIRRLPRADSGLNVRNGTEYLTYNKNFFVKHNNIFFFTICDSSYKPTDLKRAFSPWIVQGFLVLSKNGLIWLWQFYKNIYKLFKKDFFEID